MLSFKYKYKNDCSPDATRHFLLCFNSNNFLSAGLVNESMNFETVHGVYI